MTFSALLVLGWLGLAPETPATVTPPPPPSPAIAQPVPAPALQPVPAPTAVPAPTPAAADEKKDDDKKKDDAPKYEFTLGQKCESIVPCTHGSAKAEDGKAELTAEDNSLKTVLSGAAGANVFLGADSNATLSIQVVQEFEITCSDPKIQQVVLTLENSLAGFIRSKHKASACVRLASATIAPVGWATTPLSVCYPALCVSGAKCHPQGYKYSEPLEPVKAPPMPLGRYVLQANFIITASAGGLLDGHSTAIFVSESEGLDAWEREHDPFKGDAHDDFGFTLTLKADTPPGSPPVARKKSSKKTKLAARTTNSPIR